LGVLALLLLLLLRCRFPPRLPSPHRYQSRCFDDQNRTPRQLLTLNRLGNLHQRSHRPRRHYRGSQALRRHWTRDLRLEGQLQELPQTVRSVVSVRLAGLESIHTSSAISFFVLMPLARKKFSNGCCSSL
jgi:hypothetical protein